AFRLSGNTLLRAVGETTQLTATATFSAGSTRDVTSETEWTSNAPAYFSLSSGLVTAIALGYGGIQARFQSRAAGISVTVTPPGTSVYYGGAREPGNSGIPDVRVLETMSNQTRATDRDGNYQIAGLAGARLRFEKDGFELVEVTAEPASAPAVYAEAAMQRFVRIT